MPSVSGLILFQEIQREVSQERQVFRTVILADATLIFTERDGQDAVKAVLNTPVQQFLEPTCLAVPRASTVTQLSSPHRITQFAMTRLLAVRVTSCELHGNLREPQNASNGLNELGRHQVPPCGNPLSHCCPLAPV